VLGVGQRAGAQAVAHENETSYVFMISQISSKCVKFSQPLRHAPLGQDAPPRDTMPVRRPAVNATKSRSTPRG